MLKNIPGQYLNRLYDNQPPINYATILKSDELALEMVKVLIEKGANYNYKDAMLQSVLFYAMRDGISDRIQGK